MAVLAGKKILLGITGSIAAYKAAYLARILIKSGAEVKVVMTPSSTSFISPLTLSVLTGHDVYYDLFKDGSWHNHVELGLWADLMIIAPCTATTLGKMASGIADNMLLATYLSAKCPVWIAPAMDLDMWKHPSTKRNLKLLQGYGNRLLDVGYGELASGLVGEGRMAEPEDISIKVDQYFTATTSSIFEGKKVLITAGPTYEHIDPVRFIGNHSSGKMGTAIATQLAELGAEIHLVLGPSKLSLNHSSIKIYNVVTAREMLDQCLHLYHDMDISIFAAAVADYRPKSVANQKIKKSDDTLSIKLVKNPDIAKELGKQKSKSQINIGFALETTRGLEYANSKLTKKNFDLIVLNSLKDKGAGFGVDTNKITILSKDKEPRSYPLKSKTEVAEDIIESIKQLIDPS